MKKGLLLSLLITAAVAVPAFAAETAIYSSAHHGSFPVEPAKLKYTPDEFGGSQIYVLKELEWKDWGRRKAEGSGTLQSCVDGGDCFTVDALIKASHILVNDGDPVGYYSRARIIFGQNAVKLRLPTPAG
jgi:hypothetical protein